MGRTVKPVTGISRQMLAPREGWAAGRPEAALTSWVIGLGEWSPGMPDKPCFPLGWARWQQVCQPDGFEPGVALPELGPAYRILEARREPQTQLEGLEPHPGPRHHFLLSLVPIGCLGTQASSPAVSGKRQSRVREGGRSQGFRLWPWLCP